MPPQLLQRQDLEKFVEGADAAGGRRKGVGAILQDLLALAHGIGEDHLSAAGIEHALLIEKPGRNADDPAACRSAAPGHGAHEPSGAPAEQQRMPPLGQLPAEGLRGGEEGRGDPVAGSAVKTDLHRLAPFEKTKKFT